MSISGGCVMGRGLGSRKNVGCAGCLFDRFNMSLVLVKICEFPCLGFFLACERRRFGAGAGVLWARCRGMCLSRYLFVCTRQQ